MSFELGILFKGQVGLYRQHIDDSIDVSNKKIIGIGFSITFVLSICFIVVARSFIRKTRNNLVSIERFGRFLNNNLKN